MWSTCNAVPRVYVAYSVVRKMICMANYSRFTRGTVPLDWQLFISKLAYHNTPKGNLIAPMIKTTASKDNHWGKFFAVSQMCLTNSLFIVIPAVLHWQTSFLNIHSIILAILRIVSWLIPSTCMSLSSFTSMIIKVAGTPILTIIHKSFSAKLLNKTFYNFKPIIPVR